jgi:hypothetical protein
MLFAQNERIILELRNARDERASMRDDMTTIREDIALLSAMVRRMSYTSPTHSGATHTHEQGHPISTLNWP